MNRYRIIRSPSELVDLRLVDLNRSSGKLSETSSSFRKPKVLLSDKVKIKLLIATWLTGADHRAFIIFEEFGAVWLGHADLSYIGVFHNMLGLDSESKELTVCDENIDVIQLSPSRGSLFLEYSSRGPYSFHFGHFIVDTIPYLEIMRSLQSEIEEAKIITYPLAEFANQLLEISGLDIGTSLAEYAVELPLSRPSSMCNKPSWDGFELEARLIFASYKDRCAILQQPALPVSEAVRSITYSVQESNLSCEKCFVLSRSAVTNQKRRWINDNSFLEKSIFKPIQVIPEQLGPLGLLNLLSSCSKRPVVVSPLGSAALQLFLHHFQDLKPLVILIGSSCCIDALFSGQMKDFRPFRSLFWLVAIKGSGEIDWNAEFEISSFDLDQILLFILGKTNRLSDNISYRYHIIPPTSAWTRKSF